MKQILVLAIVMMACFQTNAQSLVIIDSIKPNSSYLIVEDVLITNTGQRIYRVSTRAQSLEFNNETVNLQLLPGNRYNHIISIEDDPEPDYVTIGGFVNMLTDSTYITFNSVNADTLFFKDTIFVRQEGSESYNFGLAEYSFDGELLRAKHWESTKPSHSFISINSASIKGDKMYLAGAYFNPSSTEPLDLGKHTFDYGNLYDDHYVAKLNYHTLDFDWIKGESSLYDKLGNHLIVNDREDLLQVSMTRSYQVNYCDDTLMLYDNAFFEPNYLYFIPRDSSGNCGTAFAPEINQAEIFPVSYDFTEDNSFLLSCTYFNDFIKLGDQILYDSSTSSNTALIKISPDFDQFEMFQATGSSGSKHLNAVAYGPDNEIWIAINSSADTLQVGSHMIIKQDEQAGNAVIAKLDQDLNILSIIHHGATNLKLLKGKDGNLYAIHRDANSNVSKLYLLSETNSSTQSVLDNNHINVFPNPSNTGQIQYSIEGSMVEKFKSVKLLSSLGNVVHTQSIHNLQGVIDCKSVPSGLYIMVFESVDGQIISKKIVMSE